LYRFEEYFDDGIIVGIQEIEIYIDALSVTLDNGTVYARTGSSDGYGTKHRSRNCNQADTVYWNVRSNEFPDFRYST
jgi:hypothetical protein